MPKGYVYILECNDGSYYTGSTTDLDKRIQQHQNGEGANYTKKRLPVKLIYIEEFYRIDEAFNREKQIQGWSRIKKEALIEENFPKLKEYTECKNDSHHKNVHFDKKIEQQIKKAERVAVAERNQKPISVAERSRSHGKLLLTAEYLVLDGALALAIPARFGQTLEINPIVETKLYWKSLDNNGKVWFEDVFLIDEIATSQHSLRSVGTRNDVRERLLQILSKAQKLNPDFLSKTGFEVVTGLEFPRNWGLGTSSTLINNIANWAKIDAYQLLERTFGGSGYDIACAESDSALTYQLNSGRNIKSINFNPSFKDHLYFVFLNQKQNSREGITAYKKKAVSKHDIDTATQLTKAFINCKPLTDFQALMNEHEQFIGDIIGQTPVKQRLFSDFAGSVKSLGAWGGDFVLVASKNDPTDYFNSKGFNTVLPYSKMVLS